jgi:hypothetical protein
MIISFGNHHGKSVESLVLKRPDSIRQLLFELNSQPEQISIIAEARRLIRVFDQKPFIRPCMGSGCTNTSTRLCVSSSHMPPTYWCDQCTPTYQGTGLLRPRIIRKYTEAVNFVETCCNSRKVVLRNFIRDVSRAKGLPTYVSEDRAQAFFRPL